VKLSPSIDLAKSLRQVFGDAPESAEQVEQDRERQEVTTNAILERYVDANPKRRREMVILADEVGLGKTYVALSVAVSLLDAIRTGNTPDGLPSNKPVVLVFTPTNDALFNKWIREAETFKADCARAVGELDWLDIRTPLPGKTQSGNIVDLALQMRDATRSRPMLLIAKQSVLGAALSERDWWRRRALAIVFEFCKVQPANRPWWCRRIIGTSAKSKVPELLDLRRSYGLWKEESFVSSNLYRAFRRAIHDDRIRPRIDQFLATGNAARLSEALDDLTRLAIASDLPSIPLVILDEIHNLKTETIQSRRNFETFLNGRICRLLGLSATPFQLRQDELLSILKLRSTLALPRERHEALDLAIKKLSRAMKASRDCGDVFRRRWRALRPGDQALMEDSWHAITHAEVTEQQALARQVRPPRVAHAVEAAIELQELSSTLEKHLRPFVIRHLHARSYREHFVGRFADAVHGQGSWHFSWAPGLEVRGHDELAHYLMMRAVALAKDEKGLPGLGAELTGSYRHLVETSAVWKKLGKAKNPLLKDYREVLDHMIGHRTDAHDPDREHRKVQATARRALEFFKRGQKSLIFCVYTKTAESVRDQVQAEIDRYLNEVKGRVFVERTTFDNFRRRFFNRREPLFSLIQDHPLLGQVQRGVPGVPDNIRLTEAHLQDVANLLVRRGETASNEKPDRRLLLAATEHVAVRAWSATEEGQRWLYHVLGAWKDSRGEINNPMHASRWLDAREPFSRSERAGRAHRISDPEARDGSVDPLDVEVFDEDAIPSSGTESHDREVATWVRHLREDVIGDVIAPYFQAGLIANSSGRLPLLAEHHADLLIQLDLDTRAVAGQVFRRILMADEFLLRYLADVERDDSTQWADFLSARYVKQLDGHLETLRDRVHAYLETLVRAKNNKALLDGYHAAAENRNVVQLVKGGTQNRDRYFLGFNTLKPLRDPSESATKGRGVAATTKTRARGGNAPARGVGGAFAVASSIGSKGLTASAGRDPMDDSRRRQGLAAS
jgi:hypothetical protein